MLFTRFADNAYVGDLALLDSPQILDEHIRTNNIRAVYIVCDDLNIYESKVKELDTSDQFRLFQFGGGFMLNSLILFPLNTVTERQYFEKVTMIKLEDQNAV